MMIDYFLWHLYTDSLLVNILVAKQMLLDIVHCELANLKALMISTIQVIFVQMAHCAFLKEINLSLGLALTLEDTRNYRVA